MIVVHIAILLPDNYTVYQTEEHVLLLNPLYFQKRHYAHNTN